MRLTKKYLASFHPSLVPWTDKRLVKIIRLQLTPHSDFPGWLVSYCWGEFKDGTPCFVQLPFSRLPKRNVRGAIIQAAITDRVFAKGLGINEAIVQ